MSRQRANAPADRSLDFNGKCVSLQTNTIQPYHLLLKLSFTLSSNLQSTTEFKRKKTAQITLKQLYNNRTICIHILSMCNAHKTNEHIQHTHFMSPSFSPCTLHPKDAISNILLGFINFLMCVIFSST